MLYRFLFYAILHSNLTLYLNDLCPVSSLPSLPHSRFHLHLLKRKLKPQPSPSSPFPSKTTALVQLKHRQHAPARQFRVFSPRHQILALPLRLHHRAWQHMVSKALHVRDHRVVARQSPPLRGAAMSSLALDTARSVIRPWVVGGRNSRRMSRGIVRFEGGCMLCSISRCDQRERLLAAGSRDSTRWMDERACLDLSMRAV